MFPINLPPDMFPSGNMTETTNDVGMHFLEYDCAAESGVQEENPKKPEPKTWQENVKKKRNDNLRRFFGYD